MTPIGIACRATTTDGTNCGAQAGEACRWPQPWAGMMGFHAERIEDAASIGPTVAGQTPTVADFGAAVEKSGAV